MLSESFYPNDVDDLLCLPYPMLKDYYALWDLAARIAIRLAPADLEWHFGRWITDLTKREALAPLESLLQGLLRHGTGEQLAHLSPVDLRPMLVSEHREIRELGLEFLAGLPVTEGER